MQAIGCIVKKLFASTSVPADPGAFWVSIQFGQEIQHGCLFLDALFRSLGHLPGGLARFIPCQPSAQYTRLLHVGSVVMVFPPATVKVVMSKL